MPTNTIIEENQLRPLYVRIPNQLHSYLDSLKGETGISKSDSITLILLAAKSLIDSETILEMFDKYMLEGNVDFKTAITENHTAA